MSDHYIWTHPTARQTHRCFLCGRSVLKGEPYWRMVGLDGFSAWTYRYCHHCYRCSTAWSRELGEFEWDTTSIIDWLVEDHPALYSSLCSGWRYPDGELVWLPFTPSCRSCGAAVGDGYLWCSPCDEQRIARITGQFEAIRSELTS